MYNLPELIDQFSEKLKTEFLSSVEDTRTAIELFLIENYPADNDLLPLDNSIDEKLITELETRLSGGFEANLGALSDKSELLILLVLRLHNFHPQLSKSELIKPEIKTFLAEQKRAIQIAGFSKKTLLDSIGLTPNQVRTLKVYRQELERILQETQTGRLTEIDTRIIRYLSASQRSVLRKAIARGIEPEQINTLVSNQKKALLTARAKAIGSSLSSQIAHQTQQLILDTAVNLGLIKPDEYKRFWVTQHDEKVRHNHRQTESINRLGVSVDAPFISPLGPIMAPPLERNCRCYVAIRKA